MRCRAAMQVGERAIEVRDLELPHSLPVGGALLRVEGSGMCGSDVEQYHGQTQRLGLHDYPVVPGHEIVGRIAMIDDEGRRHWGVDVGDRVAVHGMDPCGVCARCRAGRRCGSLFSYGFRSVSIGSGLWGGFAEFVELVPTTVLLPIDPDLSVEDAVLFNPLAAGFDWAIRSGGIEAGHDVLVLGPGQRGLACVIAAARAGARRIVVTGLQADWYKLDLARRLGATQTLTVDAQSVADVVAAIRELAGAVDCAIDTTPMAINPVLVAIEVVRPRGAIVLGGLKHGRTVPEFPIDRVIHKALRLQGVLGTSRWAVEQAIATIAERELPLGLLHTHTVGLDEIGDAIDLLAGDARSGKPVLHITVRP